MAGIDWLVKSESRIPETVIPEYKQTVIDHIAALENEMAVIHQRLIAGKAVLKALEAL